jgi:hypothetical protein
MKKEGVNKILRTFKNMGIVKHTIKADIEKDRKRLREFIKNKL